MPKGSSSKKKKKPTSPSDTDKENLRQDNQHSVAQVISQVDNLPPAKKKAFFSAIFSGPIPPASELQAYDQIIPGAADRIIRMAESEADHRRKQEDRMVVSACGDSRLGLWLGFIIGMTALSVGGFVAYFADSAWGSLVVLASLASLAGVFVYGSQVKKREMKKEKRSANN